MVGFNIECMISPSKFRNTTHSVFSSQDSCNEAHTPDHTAETGLTVTETPDAGVNEEADNRVDGLADLFEKLYHLNKKLEEQEDDIFR